MSVLLVQNLIIQTKQVVNQFFFVTGIKNLFGMAMPNKFLMPVTKKN
tara:strand:- start:240 stop:380 length:141 start_codon:yes stop_codon:yes gene_type:complete